jgi:hypothetical protein
LAEELYKKMHERRMQMDIDNRERPNGTVEVQVEVRIQAGRQVGWYSVFLYPSAKLRSILTESMFDLDIIRVAGDESDNPIKLPGDSDVKYTYAGKIYGGQTRLRDIANFHDGRVINLIIRKE